MKKLWVVVGVVVALAAAGLFAAPVGSRQAQTGEVLAWKNFLPSPSGPYSPPDGASNAAYAVPNFPANPVFLKVAQQSALTCWVMFDVRVADFHTVKMTLAVDPLDPDLNWHPRWIQGLAGYPNEIITFAFHVTMLSGAPAGGYQFGVVITPSGLSPTFNDQVGKIQCEEKALPPPEA